MKLEFSYGNYIIGANEREIFASIKVFDKVVKVDEISMPNIKTEHECNLARGYIQYLIPTNIEKLKNDEIVQFFDGKKTIKTKKSIIKIENISNKFALQFFYKHINFNK